MRKDLVLGREKVVCSLLCHSYKIGWFRLKETSGTHFSQPLTESRANCNVRFCPEVRWGCSCLCLVKCWISLKSVKNFVLRSNWNFSCYNLYPSPLGPFLLMSKERLAPVSTLPGVFLVPHTPAPKRLGGPCLCSQHFVHFSCTGGVQVAFIVTRAHCWCVWV